MTQLYTFFSVTDNTGVKKIFSLENKTRHSFNIKIGDILLGIIKKIKIKSFLKYSELVYGFVIRLKKNTNVYNSYNYNFNENAIVLITKNFNPLGTRIFGLFPRELKKNKYLKFKAIFLNII